MSVWYKIEKAIVIGLVLIVLVLLKPDIVTYIKVVSETMGDPNAKIIIRETMLSYCTQTQIRIGSSLVMLFLFVNLFSIVRSTLEETVCSAKYQKMIENSRHKEERISVFLKQYSNLHIEEYIKDVMLLEESTEKDFYLSEECGLCIEEYLIVCYDNVDLCKCYEILKANDIEVLEIKTISNDDFKVVYKNFLKRKEISEKIM